MKKWLTVFFWACFIHAGLASQLIISIPPKWKQQLPPKGRLFVFFAHRAQPEPRFRIGWAGPNPMPFFAVDISRLQRLGNIVVPDSIIGYPISRLRQLPGGTYVLQALLDVDTTYSFINAPGNLYSTPRTIQWKPGVEDTIHIQVSRRIPPERLPKGTRFIRFVKIKSRLLSNFWKRDMYVRAGIVLPREYYSNPSKKYPVVYRIGGFHTRYTAVLQMMKEQHPFRHAWEDSTVPPMIVVQLDGEAPFGDSYQMNSASFVQCGMPAGAF